MNNNLLRFNSKQKYIIFDYETCNLNLCSPENKPWQLSFIVASNNKIYETHDYYLRWDDLNISKDAAKITGFSKSKYDKLAVCPRKALDHFESFLYNKDYIPVGHNILGFDVYIHNIHRKLLNKKPDYSYINRAIDTNCLAKGIAKQLIKPQGKSTIAWQYSLNQIIERGLKTSLQMCAKKYKIDFDPTKLHDALYDIKINHQVLNKQLWEVEV